MSGRVVSITLIGNDKLAGSFKDSARESDKLANSLDKLASGGAAKVGNLVSAVALLGPAAGAAGAALVAAAGGVVAAFGAAGAALGAFSLAVGPQLDAAGDAMKAWENIDAAKTPEAAAKATKEWSRQMAQLPPATRDMATEMIYLKEEHKAWSKELSKDTMPVFTKAIQAARTVLPKLTPLVKTAASALSDFMDGVLKGVKSGGFDEFLDRMNSAAKKTLPSLLRSLKNVGKGLAGIFDAFLDFGPGMSSGIEDLTEKFADWGQSLKKSKGFTEFMDRVKQSAPALLSILGNLVTIFINVGQAMAPLTPISLGVIQAFTSIIASIPPSVLTAIVTAITSITVAMRVWLPIQKALNLLMMANPFGLAVLALAALGLALYTAYKKSESFRDKVNAVWRVVSEKAVLAKQKIEEALMLLVNFFDSTLLPAIGMISDKFGKISDAAGDAADGVGHAMGDSKKETGGFVNFLKTNWMPVVGGMFGGPVGLLPGLAIRFWDKIALAFADGVLKCATAILNADWPAKLRQKGGEMIMNFSQFLSGLVLTVVNFARLIAVPFTGAWNLILAIFTGKGANIRAAFGKLGRDLIDAAVRLKDSVVLIFTGLWGAIKLAFGAGIAWVMVQWRALPAKIRGVFSGAGTWLLGAGKWIVKGLWSGISSLGGWLKSQIMAFIRSFVPGPVLKLLGIASPSKVFAGIGMNVARGLAEGMLAGQGIVESAAGKLGSAPVTAGVPAGIVAPISPIATMPAAGTVGGTPIHVTLMLGGKSIGEAIIDPLRGAIRTRGGDVQGALGR